MAVKRGYPTLRNVTSAYTHTGEDELVFLEPPKEETDEHGDCLCQAAKVIYGRRKGARSRQDHLRSVVLSKETQRAGFAIRVHDKFPTMFYLEEADGILELHVDDRHGAGDPMVARKFLEFMSSKLELKRLGQLGPGSGYE